MANYTDKGNIGLASHETIVVINCALNTPPILTSITGNFLVLAAVLKTPAIHSPSMIMLCSLAFSDFLVGLIVQPLYIADELLNNLVLHRLQGMFGFYVCGVSLSTMTIISVDRLVALHCHLRYATLVTTFRVKFIVGVIWVVTFPCSGMYIWNKFVFHQIAGIFIASCLVVCTFTYIKLYRIARRHQLLIHAQQQTVEDSNVTKSIQMSRLKKTVVNTFIIYFFMVLSYFPQVVLLTLYGTTSKPWNAYWSLATTVLHMNSTINPILYCWRLRELRAAVIKMAKQLFCQQNR